MDHKITQLESYISQTHNHVNEEQLKASQRETEQKLKENQREIEQKHEHEI
jgi:hypothetical protein